MQYPLGDALGSIRAVTDTAGATTATATYDVYGTPIQTTGATNTFGYTGEQTDPTGVVNLRARMYQPTTGRFLQTDSVQPNGPATEGWGRYAYVSGNPTTWNDPTGHSTLAGHAWLVGWSVSRTTTLGYAAVGSELVAIGYAAGVLIQDCPTPGGTCDTADSDESEMPKKAPEPKPAPKNEPRPPRRPPPPPPAAAIVTSYRGVEGKTECKTGLKTSPGAFVFHADGMSTFEMPFQGDRHPCLLPFFFAVARFPARTPGNQSIVGTMFGLPTCLATYTAPPEGHWSISGCGPQEISNYAKKVKDGGGLVINPLHR